MSQMSLKELRVSVNTLASYSRAGHTMPAAMNQLVQIQPEYASFGAAQRSRAKGERRSIRR
jgi:hypothetical protein